MQYHYIALNRMTSGKLLTPPSFIHEVKIHINCFTVNFEWDCLKAINIFMINIIRRGQWAVEMGGGEWKDKEKGETVAWENYKILLVSQLPISAFSSSLKGEN